MKRFLYFILSLLIFFSISFWLDCDWFSSWQWLYKGIYINQNDWYVNNLSSCDLLDIYKNDTSNWFTYNTILSDITSQTKINYNIITNLTKNIFNNFIEYWQIFYTGNTELLSNLWFNKQIFYTDTNPIIIWPNITFIYPYKPVYTAKKYIPIIIYVNDKQQTDDSDLTLTLYASNKDFENNIQTLNDLAKAKLSFDVQNKHAVVVVLNIDEIRNADTGKIYLYAYVTNIYNKNSRLIKTYFNFNRINLKGELAYTEDYVDYDWKKWTKLDNPSIMYLYTNLPIKTVISNNDLKVTIWKIEEGNYLGNKYHYKAILNIFGWQQGYNQVDINITDVYWHEINLVKDLYIDSKGPDINLADLTDKYKIIYNWQIYLNTVKYKENNWFDFKLNVKDEATKTVKVIIKTDINKKIILDIKDGVDYVVKQLTTNFSTNGERLLTIEAYDVLWNISKKSYLYNVLDISYPVITYPPKDNLIVVSPSIDFKGFCTNITAWQIKYKLNDNPESDRINYTDNWSVNQILKKGYNIFKIKCKNIVGESDYVERIVIYEPKENIGWRNYMLQMYPNFSKKLYIERSNKNADNDTIRIIEPDLYKNLPWFNIDNNE